MMRMTGLAAVLLLAACQPGAPQGGEPSDAPAPMDQPAEPAPVDPRAISAAGVGPLNATTPFDRDAIAALFPGSEVQAEFLHFGEGTTPIITVTGPDEIALEIQGGADGLVSQVIVSGGPFTGPEGAGLLAGWPELGVAAADCVMGEGRFVGQPICRKAGAPNLAYVLSVPRWRGEGLPDPTTLNGRARLAEYVWTRP